MSAAPAPRPARRRAWALAVALWAALAAPFVWRFSGDAPDDVFITYRYAQNLAAGRGFVFNPGERVFGLTDPGLGAALGALHAATGAPIPLLGTLATAAALVSIAALLFAGAVRSGHGVAAAAGGGLVAASGYLWAGQGSGPVVALALLLAAAALAWGRKGRDLAAGIVAGRDAAADAAGRDVAAGIGAGGDLAASIVADRDLAAGIVSGRDVAAGVVGGRDPAAGIVSGKDLAAGITAGRDLAAGIVAGLAIAVRPDAALGAAILGLLLIFERRRLPWRFALGLAATVALAALAAFSAFGTVVPATLLAKRQMAALAAPGRLAAAALFWRRAAVVAAFYLGPLALPVAALAAAGQALLWTGAAGRPGRLLAGVALGTALAYTVLGVPFFTWYLAPVVVALLGGAALAAGWLLARLREESIRPPGPQAAESIRPQGPLAAESVRPRGPLGAESIRSRRLLGAGSIWPRRLFGAESIRPRGPLGAESIRPRRLLGAELIRPRRLIGAESIRPRRLLGAAWVLLSLLGIAAVVSPLVASARVVAAGPRGDWRRAAYVAAGRWLRARSRPDERIALEEVGLVAYTADRRVLDLVGLVSPSSLPYAAVSDPLGAFLAAPTDYVLFHTFTAHGGTVGIVRRPWFPRAYSLAARLDFPALGGSVFLYHRRPGIPLPPPRPPFPATLSRDQH